MPKAINVDELTKEYNGTKVVDGVNFAVNCGEIYGLLGRNGAGKTTIMKMLLGLTRPTSGRVAILQKDMHINSNRKILRRVGCIIESPGFYPNLTGTENLEIFAVLRGLNQISIRKALELVNLPYRDKKTFSKYSLGMKQRLAIANAIMHDPDILILDEPINGLDPIGIAEVRDLLKRLKDNGVSVLISSHILSELESLTDRIGIIDSGRMLEEIRLNEWKNTGNTGIRVTVKESQRARNILLNSGISAKKIKSFDEGIFINADDIQISDINKALVANDIDVVGITEEKTTLEDYFKRITGGRGIG